MDRSTWISPQDKDIKRATARFSRNEQRKPRILDPRVRKIGLDLDTLAQQVEWKKSRQAQVDMRNKAFDQHLLDHQEEAVGCLENYNATVRQLNIDRDTFRRDFQRPEQSREYDIWRKDYNQVNPPIRMGDEDPRLGVSSGQIFFGEDLRKKERDAEQAAQRLEWYNTQKREKEVRLNREKAHDMKEDIKILEAQKLCTEYMQRDEEAKALVRRQLADDNRALHEEKKERLMQEKLYEEKFNDAEQRAICNTDSIVEVMAPRGSMVQDYRGMTIDEQRKILDEQKSQMLENERLRQEEREREKQWEEYMLYLKTQGDQNELEWRRRNFQVAKELAQTQLQQAKDQKERQRYLNKKVYGENIPDDYYYNQWGKEIR